MERNAAKTFRDLVVWQKAHGFVLAVYRLTRRFPREELYTLTSQLRRAAISVPANIAEGFKKHSDLDKARFYNISQGSLEECRYYLLLTHDLGYAEVEDEEALLEEVSRLLERYCQRVREKKGR
jgi:four helix bundle protein